MFVDAAHGISEVTACRDRNNQSSSDSLPPVLPHQLTSIDMRQFSKLVEAHRARLCCTYSSDDMETLGQEFRELRRAYNEEPVFKAALEDCRKEGPPFKECWSITSKRFPMLQAFCGGLASAFPNTATVESDFSVIGVEKNVYRKSLTDFSLEGVLHCKQFSSLQQLAASL